MTRKQIVVKWTPVDIKTPGSQIAFEAPQSLAVEVGREFSKTEFWKCPAVTAMCVNTFLIRAPFDITLHLTRHDNGDYSFTTPNVDQPLVDEFFIVRRDGTVTLPPRYVLYCDEPLMMEVIPAPFFHPLTNMAFVAGAYDIGKWIRPLEFAVRVVDTKLPIDIKRGDPLFCVRLLPEGGTTIHLERVLLTQELLQVLIACTGTKQYVQRQPLTTLYSLAAPLLSAFRNRSAKGEKK